MKKIFLLLCIVLACLLCLAGTAAADIVELPEESGRIWDITNIDRTVYVRTSRGQVYAFQPDSGTLNLNGTTISNCYASENGGGIYHAGTMNAYGTISGCAAKVGGGVYSAAALNFTSNVVSIENCRARNVTLAETTGTATEATDFVSGNLGGGVYNAGGELKMSNAVIKGCQAYDGGGVYQAGGTFNLSGGTIGGIVEETNDVTIDNRNIASNNGGGVYHAGGTFAMSDGTIGDSGAEANTSVNGAGVYVAAGQTMTMSGGNITHNRATTTGGGIATGSGATLNFSGTVSVKDNTLGEADCNVYLGYNDNTIINNKGISADSTIGVYVSDAQMDAHGRANRLFGSYNNAQNHNRFLNDRVNYLFGMRASDNKMIWSDQVCRITDKAGNLLYRDKEHSMPAVYTKLENGLDDSAFDVLEKNDPGLYTKDGDLYSETEGNDNTYQVQMLVPEYLLTQQIMVANDGRTVTLTKATTLDECGFVYPADDLKHPTPAIIRSGSFGSMISLSSGSLILTEIILDGDKDNYTATGNGGLISVSGGSAVIQSDAVLRNSESERRSNIHQWWRGDAFRYCQWLRSSVWWRHLRWRRW